MPTPVSTETYPGDWVATRIGDVATFEVGFPFSSSHFNTDGAGIRLIRNGDLRSGMQPVWYDGPYDSSYLVRDGDLLVGMDGDFTPVQWLGGTALLNQRVGRVHTGEQVDGTYLRYALEEPLRGLERSTSATTVKHMSHNDVADMRIHLPPLFEQTEIAEVLDDCDRLIESLDELASKKASVRDGVLDRLTSGEPRLPGHKLPWEEARLGDLGQTYSGLSGKSGSDFGHGDAEYVPFLSVIQSPRVNLSELPRVDLRPAERQNEIHQGDILLNGSSETPEEVALASYVEDEAGSVYLNSFCFGFRPTSPETIDGLFLTYFLRGSSGRQMIFRLAQGSTRYNISKTALMEAQVSIPPIAEQKAIAEVLSDMDAEIDALVAQRDKTAQLKQAMMQELLTGRTRLS